MNEDTQPPPSGSPPRPCGRPPDPREQRDDDPVRAGPGRAQPARRGRPQEVHDQGQPDLSRGRSPLPFGRGGGPAQNDLGRPSMCSAT